MIKSKTIDQTEPAPNKPFPIYHKFDNYSCPLCPLLPEILNYNEPKNLIKLKCSKHGEKEIDIHEYLEKMAKYEYLSNNSKKYKCQEHSDNPFIFYCKTCEKNLCQKCDKEQLDLHSSHKKYKISSFHPNNSEVLIIKNKINIYQEEKIELKRKLSELEDKITFYDSIINSLEKQKENFLLNINVMHLIYGENLNYEEIIHKSNENGTDASNQELRKEKFDEFIRTQYFQATKKIGELCLVNKKAGNEIITDLIEGIDNNRIVRILKIQRKLNEENTILSYKNLKVLNLRGNNLSTMDFLVDKKFPNLEVLSFNDNEISSIENLSKIEMPNLQQLFLSKNKLSSIDVLGEVSFIKLQTLWLSDNNISNIKVFEKVK